MASAQLENAKIINIQLTEELGKQMAMNLGLFKVEESVIPHPNGQVTVVRTTKVTGKGQQYFINKFLKSERTNRVKTYLQELNKTNLKEVLV